MCCSNETRNTQANAKHYLVQYVRGDNIIIHAAVHRAEICWPIGELYVQQKVLIRDGRYQRIATILYMHETQNRVLYELRSLKANCFHEHGVAVQKARRSRRQRMYGRQDSWLLVQYSKTTSSVAYAIVQETAAVWPDRRNKDIFVYLKNGAITCRAIILHKSSQRRDLIYKLRNIRLHCLEHIQFPLTNSFRAVAERTNKHRHILQKISQSVDVLNTIDEQHVKQQDRFFYVVQFLRIVYKTIMDRLSLKIVRELDLLTLKPPTLAKYKLN